VARVLLVDDDPEFADALSAWLGLRGHEVRAAADGRNVAAIAREFAPDLVLLDAVLGGASGEAIARELADAGVRRVVFCTALPPRQLPPGVAVLEKPLRLELLEAALAAAT
jgi:DNA-binding response OmpR family regulator